MLLELKSGVPDSIPLNAYMDVPEATNPVNIMSAFLTPNLSIKKPPTRGRKKLGIEYIE